MLPQNDVHTEFIRKKSRYETRSWLGLARPPEADLDGVGICEVAAVVPNPVAAVAAVVLQSRQFSSSSSTDCSAY